ncbi:MAG: gluconate 2-dehydrogenase subunit 3 family protein [Ginsengibacter sp.]
MDRRKSLKVMVLGTVSSGFLLQACETDNKKTVLKKASATTAKKHPGLMKEEVKQLEEVNAYTFFTPHEMQTITILGDIIIPKDEVSGSASDAKVPDFIEFIVKDKPEYQVPLRGGLKWLDMECLARYQKAFTECDQKQQMEMVDEIAWPKKAKPEMKQGVSFFNLMRNLTATGFYTTAIGVKDIGYIGNTPNQWNGVPEDVLKKHNLAYTEKELKECISF